MKEKLYYFVRIGVCSLYIGTLFVSLILSGEFVIKFILKILGV